MRRAGFTLTEALVAAGLGTIILGTGMLMWMNGSRSFTKATQHASIREQALVLLERIGRDLDGLMVSHELNPRTRRYYMVQPYELLDAREETEALTLRVPGTGPSQQARLTARGIRFHVYHRTEMTRVEDGKRVVESEKDDRAEPDDGTVRLPRIVGRYVEYTTQPSPEKGGGVDLYRNGVKVNSIALTEVRFERADPVHVKKSMGASPNAVLNVTIVPRAGIEGQLDEATVRRQDATGTALSRMFHLVGYESQYTALLGAALDRKKEKLKLDPLEVEVVRDARVWGVLEDAKEKLEAASIAYRLPADLVTIEHDKAFDGKALADSEFRRAETRQGTSLAAVLKQGGEGAGSGAGSGGQRAGSSTALGGAP